MLSALLSDVADLRYTAMARVENTLPLARADSDRSRKRLLGCLSISCSSNMRPEKTEAGAFLVHLKNFTTSLMKAPVSQKPYKTLIATLTMKPSFNHSVQLSTLKLLEASYPRLPRIHRPGWLQSCSP